MDMFFLLAIKVFRCFHQHVDNFFHQCVNMVWTTKGTDALLTMLFPSIDREYQWLYREALAYISNMECRPFQS
jgi:hypothetical protein